MEKPQEGSETLKESEVTDDSQRNIEFFSNLDSSESQAPPGPRLGMLPSLSRRSPFMKHTAVEDALAACGEIRFSAKPRQARRNN